MNSEQIKRNLLINEWQLGSQLNQAVIDGTRCKFNLLLSLLSDDARDFAEFSFKEKGDKDLAQAQLRSSLFLPEAQPLINKGISLMQAELLNEDLQHSNLNSMRLRLLLNNEAVLSRNEKDDIPVDVVENLNLLTQHRLSQSLHQKAEISKGVDVALMKQYQQLDLDNRPLQVTY